MPDPATTTSPPTLLGGRYLLRGELGHGGMARVHRAVDQVLDREVAVKVLYANLAHDPVFVDRFRREAWAGARLSHPNVVSVYDVAAPVPKGDDPSGDVDGPVYMVLQLVEGPSLREVLLAHRRITPAQALGVLGQAAGGLGAAHDAGLVHRDVKPENVLLTPQGGVKVTDFGLARAAAESTQTFGADVIVGSPHYLSPEAVAAEPLDSRSDVYGLGVVLYECLTGRPPFEGESALATALQHRARRVPRPSAAVPGVTPAVDDVVRRATAPDPADRYEDATAFGRALGDAVADEPAPLPRTATPRTTAVIPITATDTIVGRGAAPPAPDGATDRAPGTPDGPAAGGPPDPDPPVSGPAEDAHEDAHEPDTGDASRPRRRWLRWLLVAALAVSALALGGFLVWDNVLAPVTPIPQVARAPAGAAESTLEEAGFLVEIADERRHHLEVAEGLVLEQDPTGHARRGTAVTLVLSAGPRQVEVPSLSGRPLKGARTELQGMGLEVSVERTHDEQVAEGHALSTDPAAGEVVDEGSAVTLVVSDGPRPIEVPTVVGEAETAALATLRQRGLAPEVVDRRYDPDAPEGAVIAQSPEGGAVLTGGGGVELVVSRGPEPFDMPNVRGQRAQEARKQLEGLGLDVEVERQAGAGSDPGRVYDQDPAPRTRVHPGDAVTLYAYEG